PITNRFGSASGPLMVTVVNVFGAQDAVPAQVAQPAPQVLQGPHFGTGRPSLHSVQEPGSQVPPVGGGGGAAPAQPAFEMPNPGLERRIRPSGITVAIPTGRNSPMSWSNENRSTSDPGAKPRLGSVTT